MKIYLAAKYYEDHSNRPLIDSISASLASENIICINMARDHERWGECRFSPEELMRLTFKEIDDSQAVVIEFSEKGVGLGIEAGYAFAKNIPIIVVAPIDADISGTLRGIAKAVISYSSPYEIGPIVKQTL